MHDYKDYLLWLIFYKYLSENEEKFWFLTNFQNLNWEFSYWRRWKFRRLPSANIGYDSYKTYSPYGYRWKRVQVDNLHTALSAFNRYFSKTIIKIFNNIFNALETGLSKLEQTPASRQSMLWLIHLVNVILLRITWCAWPCLRRSNQKLWLKLQARNLVSFILHMRLSLLMSGDYR